MRDVRVAAVCMTSLRGEVEQNLEKTRHYVSEAKANGADIVCFPELSVSGYTLRTPDGLYSVRKAGEIIRRIEALARDHGVIVLAGLAEIPKEGKPFIAQVVAGPKGLLGIHRKTHLSPPEKGRFQSGEEIRVFEQGGIRFGVQLCYEAHFPEISTLMAMQGAEVLFLPHASPRGSPEEKLQSWMRHLPARAFDNALYVVACNQAGGNGEGLSFPGTSMMVAPDGRVIASRREKFEGMLVEDLSGDTLTKVRKHRMRYFLPSRRPELYGPLARSQGGRKKKGTR